MIAGLGVDVVDVDRFERSLARTPRLAARLFTESELSVGGASRSPRSLAARFAAKEATMKALGAARISKWLEIEVAQGEDGAPSIVLHGGARELAGSLGVTAMHVSMSHDGAVAMATVIAESGEDSER